MKANICKLREVACLVPTLLCSVLCLRRYFTVHFGCTLVTKWKIWDDGGQIENLLRTYWMDQSEYFKDVCVQLNQMERKEGKLLRDK